MESQQHGRTYHSKEVVTGKGKAITSINVGESSGTVPMKL